MRIDLDIDLEDLAEAVCEATDDPGRETVASIKRWIEDNPSTARTLLFDAIAEELSQ